MVDPLPDFNVGYDPWIPVIREGVPTRVSARDALAEAHLIDGFDVAKAPAIVATVRHLVAMCQRIEPVENSAAQEELWDRGRYDIARVDAYFRENRSLFNLFDDRRPFGQVAGLTPVSGDPKPPSMLSLSAASGNNVPLFSATHDGNARPLAPADALLGLLTLGGFDTAAIKPGAVGDPQVTKGKTTGNRTGVLGYLGVVLPLGRNLFETLVLNTPALPIPEQDAPVWEREITPAWELRQPVGPLELLTWSSRRMRLVSSDDRREVTGLVLAAGDRVDFIPPQWEPHSRFQPTKKDDVVAERPIRWPSGRQAWRGLDSLVAVHQAGGPRSSMLLRQVNELQQSSLPLDYPLNVLCVGMSYGNQSAVIEDAFVDQIPLPVSALADGGDVSVAIGEIVATADAVREALNHLDTNIRRACGAEAIDWKVGVHPGDDAMALLDAPTRRFLVGVQREPEKAEVGLDAWQRSVAMIAERQGENLLDRAPLAAIRGRAQGASEKAGTFRLFDAERIFRSALRKALPRAYRREES